MKTLLAVSILILTSCATPYQKVGFLGGYNDIKMGDNLYQVSASGNGFTSRATVQQIALRRCAELTLENGFEYFLVLDKEAGTASNFVNSGTTGTITPNYYGGYSYNARSTGHTVTKHDNSVLIKLFKKGEHPPMAFSAADILKSFGVASPSGQEQDRTPASPKAP